MPRTNQPMALSLRALSHLLRYPDAALRSHLDEIDEALAREAALSAPALAALRHLTDALREPDWTAVEARYVEQFDRGRRSSLHLFEHVHGDSRDRGPAMIDLIRTYESAGLLLAPDELPDHLSVLLEFASTQPPAAARAFIGEFGHLLQAIHAALAERGSPYAAVLVALLALAGLPLEAPARTEEEPPLDASWDEPAAFEGCSSAGQARPGQSQPVHLMPRAAAGRGHPLPPQGA
jgi:nitrate reductase molybdenum cofactor assembly chaperone NarJ/NarW